MTKHDGRVPVPNSTDLRDDAAQLLPLIAPPGREPARTMAILALQPDLLAPFLGWAAALALHGVLSHRDHELLALRCASRCGSEFEWSEHVEFARGASLTNEEIARVTEPIDDAWTDAEAALLRAVDELTTGFDVTDATWETLARHHDQAARVEILFVVGQYTMLSMVANAAGLPA
jgi:4-carboxymuconolactone decarboxylase